MRTGPGRPHGPGGAVMQCRLGTWGRGEASGQTQEEVEITWPPQHCPHPPESRSTWNPGSRASPMALRHSPDVLRPSFTSATEQALRFLCGLFTIREKDALGANSTF